MELDTVAEDLLRKGVDNGDLNMVKEALDQNASPNTVFNEDWGWKVLDRALFQGSVPVAQLLLDAGAEVDHMDVQNENCLFRAIDLGNMDLIERIVKKGANVNQASHDQQLTPICIALLNKNLEAAKYLVEQGAKINPFEPDDSIPFSLVIDNTQEDEDISKFLDFLIQAGLDINAQDPNGWTLVMKSIKKGLKKTFEYFMEKNASVSLISTNGNNAVLEAACKEDPEYLLSVISAGGNPNASMPSGFSPLMAACKFGFLENCKNLIQAGAATNATDGSGLTSLMYAATSNAEIVTYLIQNGADPEIKCNQGKMAIKYAREFENENAYKLLMEQY